MVARADKEFYTAVGLMSGTSMDGVDAALVELSSDPDHPEVRLRAFVTAPYPEELREVLAELATGGQVTAEDVARLHTSVAVAFAGAFFDVCRQSDLPPERVDFIGSHGQTVAHAPPGPETSIAGTLQLGPPGMIAALTGVTTVGDFRVADMALGGQGAPLAPYADYLLRRSDTQGRIILNIGGIANLTYLPRKGRREDVIAFDTGPGNMVVDTLYRVLFPGGGAHDTDGAHASAGTVASDIVDALLAHPYFTTPPPKSAGHREFGASYAWALNARADAAGIDRESVLATAVALTVRSIAEAIERFVQPVGAVDVVYVTGGGVHNRAVMSGLAESLAGTAISPIDALGIPADAKEAVDFALLARETICGRPNLLPAVTGAARPLVLGSIARGGAVS